MDCRSCGKAVPTGQARCPHCGETVVAADFRSLREVISSDSPSEEVQRLLEHTPSARGAGVRLVLMVIFGLGIVGLTIFFFIVTTRRRDAAPIFQVFMSIVRLVLLHDSR
jgi:RNA polymerase subunit RPABC4/transcription elongation factor Spt4